jgi:hypothetical protein
MEIQYGVVVLAAVVNFIIGFLFHGPLFGKLWMKLANIHPTGNEKFKDMVPQMVKNMIMNLICAYVLAVFITIAGKSITNGICIAILVWFGFIVTGSSMDVIWMGKSKKLWLFEVISSLVSLIAMGVLIGAM